MRGRGRLKKERQLDQRLALHAPEGQEPLGVTRVSLPWPGRRSRAHCPSTARPAAVPPNASLRRLARWAVASVAAALLLTAPPGSWGVALSQVAPLGPPPPRFTLGFSFLKALLGPTMGDPLENERGNPDSCDTQQLTTTGLAYWRCSTNTMTFTALPDGLRHWAWIGGALVEWYGPTPDPPADILAGLVAPCPESGSLPGPLCTLRGGATVTGYVRAPGATNTYRLLVPGPVARVRLDLLNLPADYDLYLADASGTVVARSLSEGASPEAVETLLAGGTYFAYVRVDPSRPASSDGAYTLQVSVVVLSAQDSTGG